MSPFFIEETMKGIEIDDALLHLKEEKLEFIINIFNGKLLGREPANECFLFSKSGLRNKCILYE